MTQNERKALVEQLCRRLNEKANVSISQAFMSIIRPALQERIHPSYLTDEELYVLLNPPKEEKKDAIG